MRSSATVFVALPPPLLLLLLVLCSCLCALVSPAVCAVAPQEAPLVFHTSLVELLNAEKSQWSISLGSATTQTTTADLAAGDAKAAVTAIRDVEGVAWTDMRETWVESQPTESAASLLFALPPPTPSHYGLEDEEAAAQQTNEGLLKGEKDAVEGDNALTLAQRRQLFGLPSFSFHGLSCEEYGSAHRHQHSGTAAATLRHGRCYLLCDSGEDLFFNYRVEPQEGKRNTASTEEEEAAEGGNAAGVARHHSRHSRHGRRAEGAASATTQHGGQRSAEGHAAASAASRASTPRVPQTSVHDSVSGVWKEFVLLPGAETGVVGDVEDVCAGSVRLSENLMKNDGEDSARVQLSFTVALFDTKTATAAAAGTTTGVPLTTLHLRVKGMTGTYCEQAEHYATMAQQAERTSFFNRWLFPIVYIGCLYGLVYGVAWWQAKRKASTPAAASSAGAAGAGGATPNRFPSTAKKQQ
jgi:hypothetical protein